MSAILENGGLVNELWLEVLQHMPNFKTLVLFACTSKHMHGLAFGDGTVTKFANAAVINQFDPRVFKVAFVAIHAHETTSWIRSWPPETPNGQPKDFQRALIVTRPLDIDEIRQLATLDATVDSLVTGYIQWTQKEIPAEYRGSEWSKEELLRVKSTMWRYHMMCRIACNQPGKDDLAYILWSSPFEQEQAVSIRKFLQEEGYKSLTRLYDKEPHWKDRFGERMAGVLQKAIMSGLAKVHRLVSAKEFPEIVEALDQASAHTVPISWHQAWRVGTWWPPYVEPSIVWHPDDDTGPRRVWEWINQALTAEELAEKRRRRNCSRSGPVRNERPERKVSCKRWGCFFWDATHVDVLMEYGILEKTLTQTA